METTIFKTLTLGESKASLKKKLTEYKVSNWAKELFEKISISPKQDIDLVILTPRDLGFTGWPTTTELFAKAKAQGYDLCPQDVGPVLRVNYDDQPKGEWLVIAMEPITVSGGSQDVFYVEHGGDERWLYANRGDPGGVWSADCRFVFVRKDGTQPSDTKSSSDPLSLESRVKELESQVEMIINWAKKLIPPEL